MQHIQKNFMTIDIGGSLIKLVLVEYIDSDKTINEFIKCLNGLSTNYQVLTTKNNKYFNNKTIKLHFFLINKSNDILGRIADETSKYSQIFLNNNTNNISITGACSNVLKKEFSKKFENGIININTIPLEFFTSYAGVVILNEINGINKNEIFKYDKIQEGETGEYNGYKRVNIDSIDNSYVFMSIGTGTSILYINNNKVTYVQHSNISGATYLGLCKLIGNCNTFEDAVKASEQGDFKKVDYTMRDLICDKKENMDAIAETMKESHVTESGNAEGPDFDFIINSFGKYTLDGNLKESISKNDLANATLMMVINSCSLNAYHIAKLNSCKQIVFGGSFLSMNNYGKFCAAKLIRYLSNGKMDALFFDKDAFINAVGCFYDFEVNKVEFESFM